MDEIEITVFDEINDYKEKIYFFNFRQWVFAIIIIGLVVPTYIFLKNKIGEEITSYLVIAIAGILGFIGFVKIHELPAEQILPYWFRHYFCFAKPIPYITDEEFAMQHQKKSKENKISKNKKLTKKERRELKKKKKEEKQLTKNKKKNKIPKTKLNNKKGRQHKLNEKNSTNELVDKLFKLDKEQQEALLKLLNR